MEDTLSCDAQPRASSEIICVRTAWIKPWKSDGVHTELRRSCFVWRCQLLRLQSVGNGWESMEQLWDVRVQLKCDGTRWRKGGEVKGKLTNGVGSQYSSHYLGTWCIQHYYCWCAHLGCQQSNELTPPADLNRLVHFAEIRNLVSSRVPSHFKRSLLTGGTGVLGRKPARVSHCLPRNPTWIGPRSKSGLRSDRLATIRQNNVMLCYAYVMLCYVMSCYVMLCYVMLCCVTLCYVMLCHAMLCYAMLCCVTLCYVMLCHAMLCYTMLCCVTLCYVMLCYVMLCYVMLCCVMLCYVMLCYVMLCYAMLCYAMLRYAMLCYIMLLCYVMLCYAMLCYAMLWYVMLLCYVMQCYVTFLFHGRKSPTRA
jgi:hypothetical protein